MTWIEDWDGPMPLKEVCEATLSRVLLAEQRIEAFVYATRNLMSDLRHPAIKDNWDSIHRVLLEDQTQAYRDLFMWGCVIDGEMQRKAKQIALDKFLDEGAVIMQQLRHDFLIFAPRSYFAITEEELREEIAELEKKDD